MSFCVVKPFLGAKRVILFYLLTRMQAHLSKWLLLKKFLAKWSLLKKKPHWFLMCFQCIPSVLLEQSWCEALTTHWSTPPPPTSFHISVYTLASNLSGAHTHVPDIKLLMKYLPDLKGLLQPAPKPQSPQNISWSRLVSRLWRRSLSSIWNRSIKKPSQFALVSALMASFRLCSYMFVWKRWCSFIIETTSLRGQAFHDSVTRKKLMLWALDCSRKFR